jgi:hypothetical protein
MSVEMTDHFRKVTPEQQGLKGGGETCRGQEGWWLALGLVGFMKRVAFGQASIGR